MPINSAARRRSASQVWLHPPAVLPDNDMDQEDRQQAAWTYIGIASQAPDAGTSMMTPMRGLWAVLLCLSSILSFM